MVIDFDEATRIVLALDCVKLYWPILHGLALPSLLDSRPQAFGMMVDFARCAYFEIAVLKRQPVSC